MSAVAFRMKLKPGVAAEYRRRHEQLWPEYSELSNDARCLAIMRDWSRDRFRAGTPTKNVNTMAPLLTLAYLYERSGDMTYHCDPRVHRAAESACQ